ncbi:MAG: universal stress protein [Bacteroidales bacterium]|jgi:nucleotide-binding universal stress UspA family protein|nr:universal stress protein [Bacteroidales bacterium]
MIKRTIERILIPIALTREGEVAIEQAVRFHKVFGSRLIIMNVIPASRKKTGFLTRETAAGVLEKAHLRLEEFITKYFGGTLPDYVNLQVRCGGLIQSIIDASKDFSSQLIIIKKSSRLIGRFAAFRRHNAEKLIGQSFCPVLTISENFTHEKIKEIVMPVDITKKTDDKIRWAIFLAQSFNARVTVISVLDINIEARTSLAYRKAVAIEEQLNAEKIECDVQLITETSGAHYDIFLKQAEKVNPDLIIIMTHEESILFGDYIGPFAREVIHRAVQPVFNVVPRVGTLFDVFEDEITEKES